MIVTRLDERYTFRPVLYTDWDGTVRRSKSGKRFIQGRDDIEIIPGAEEMMWTYRNKGFLIVAISNQGSVAHGIRTVPQIADEMKATLDLFKENPYHSIEMCLFMENGTVEPYRHRSLLRKPDYGMLVKVEEKMFAQGIVIDYTNSIFVGDRPEDQECAEKVGIKFMWADDWLIPHPITISIGETDRKWNGDLKCYQDELFNLEFEHAKDLLSVDGLEFFKYGLRRKEWPRHMPTLFLQDGCMMHGSTQGPITFIRRKEDMETKDWMIVKL